MFEDEYLKQMQREDEYYKRIEISYNLKRGHKAKKEKNTQLLNQIEEFRVKNNVHEPKCISDRLLLYLRYGIDSFGLPWSQDAMLNNSVMKLYGLVRGDMNYTNKNPLSVASAILYISCIIS